MDPKPPALAAGRPYLAIPGPSVMPDRVLRAMHRAAPNIYGDELHDLTRQVRAGLCAVAQTEGHVAMYIGNGHAAWEAADANIFSRGDAALVPATGLFGRGWAAHATAMGVEVQMLDFGRSSAADPARVEAALRADRDRRIKAVLATHVDTASTVRNDIAAIRTAIDAAGHPALLAVDAIASLACDDLQMDAWGVDVLLSASQKGLMTPPGLAFVWMNDRALAATAGAGLRTPYWDWRPRIAPAEYWQNFYGTAPTHLLFGLAEALDMILNGEGLTAVLARHDRLARSVWAAVEGWSVGNPAIGLNVADPAARSRAVTSVRLGAPDATRLRMHCEARLGVTLGIGLGMETAEDPRPDGWLRIAHMGHVNAHMTLGALAVIEAGMKALGIPFGAGGTAAAAHVLAG